MHTPSEVRPHRPLRWFADAWEIGSIGSRWTLVRRLYRDIRAVPGSITYLMPGTVSEVSATLVARTTRRPPCLETLCGWLCLPVSPLALCFLVSPLAKTRCCSAADSRA